MKNVQTVKWNGYLRNCGSRMYGDIRRRRDGEKERDRQIVRKSEGYTEKERSTTLTKKIHRIKGKIKVERVMETQP